MHAGKRMRPRLAGNPNPRMATEPQRKPSTEGGKRAASMMVVPRNMSEMKATSEAARQLGRGE